MTDEMRGEKLPDREAMSLVDANLPLPVNAALAADGRSNDAEQDVDSEQST